MNGEIQRYGTCSVGRSSVQAMQRWLEVGARSSKVAGVARNVPAMESARWGGAVRPAGKNKMARQGYSLKLQPEGRRALPVWLRTTSTVDLP